MDNSPILRVTDLHKSFSGIVAASNLNVDVAEGEIVGVIGANGAGKTVFINMITGYLKPSSGKIEFAGKDITGIEPRNATHMGVCRSFQVSQVFMTMSVLENMLIALSVSKDRGFSILQAYDRPELIAECEQIMARYNLSEFRDLEVSTLSQGVRKLLDIAMAIVSEPKVLLLDEPTSGVSSEDKFPIMDVVIDDLKKRGTSVLFVEHDMEIVERYVDRVLAFYQGEIICDAPPAEALKDPKVIEYVVGSDHDPKKLTGKSTKKTARKPAKKSSGARRA